MPKSPYSGATHIEPPQIQLDATMNGAINRLDSSTHSLLIKALTSADYTLTSDATSNPTGSGEAEQSGYIRVTGVFTANRTLTLPNNNDAGSAARPKHYVLEHSGTGGFTLTIKTVSGTGVTLNQGNAQAVYCDGVNVVPIGTATGAGGAPYDLAVQRDGLPTAGAVIFTHLPTRAFSLPIALAGSRFILAIATTVAIAFSVRKNGSQFGTINFAIGATTATFTAASATAFTSSDKLTIVAPSPQDATASDFAGTLKGTAT